ncbi:hypothetical protein CAUPRSCDRAFT_11325 [Caulochytrium protostelioides]|uniref:Reverse transcriptase domain-containing protein n=1 Tax=Caulochytrium protostelioides TaxID=1555241 RepID=A0A4P9WWB3_9FUNG|nr:hypothetical protein CAUPRSCDRAFT_11325 [Caulochytrium protostelioides]
MAGIRSGVPVQKSRPVGSCELPRHQLSGFATKATMQSNQPSCPGRTEVSRVPSPRTGGVQVPTGRQGASSLPPLRLLKFADDVALVAEDAADMQMACDGFTSWADTHQMRVGIAKCGIMQVPAGDDPIAPPVLQRQPLPVVDHYVYLGICLDSGLSNRAMVSYRADKGAKALGAMTTALRDRRLPLWVRMKLVRAVLIPTLTFGAELFQSSLAECAPLQRVASRALRLVIGRGAGRISQEVLATDLGAPLIAHICRAARRRAYFKWPSLRTWAAQLIEHTPSPIPREWSRGSWVAQARRTLTSIRASAPEDSPAVTGSRGSGYNASERDDPPLTATPACGQPLIDAGCRLAYRRPYGEHTVTPPYRPTHEPAPASLRLHTSCKL